MFRWSSSLSWGKEKSLARCSHLWMLISVWLSILMCSMGASLRKAKEYAANSMGSEPPVKSKTQSGWSLYSVSSASRMLSIRLSRAR